MENGIETDVYTLLLHVEGVSNPLGLRLKDREKAEALERGVWDVPANQLCTLEDAYGARVSFPRARLQASSVVPVSGELEMQMDLQMMQARANARLQSRAASDPMLKLLGGGGGLVRAQ